MGKIFDIQHFCTDDGPGIRTTVFLKGCPLRCLWCHNPESQLAENEILFYREKCTGCGRCRGLTADSGDFVCYSGAKRVCGREATAPEVLEAVMKDELFYKNSGGGITLSGGEPLFQPNFALEILRLSKERGLHTAVETCGFVKPEILCQAAEFTDLFLFDFKETDPEKHRAYTGADNALILENLRLLETMGKDVILRCPIIPGYNDREDHFDGICAVANRHRNILRVEIEPYHAFGEAKYAALGRQSADVVPMRADAADAVVERLRKDCRVQVKKA